MIDVECPKKRFPLHLICDSCQSLISACIGYTKGKRGKKNKSFLLLPIKGYLGTMNTNGRSGQTGRLPWSDLARTSLTLIFPEHTTNATQIKSLLFTVTFFFPSFLGEIFPPSPGISVTGYPLQNKRPSSAVTQSQYGRLVRFWACHTVTSVLLLFTHPIHRWEKASWDKTWWLIAALPRLTDFSKDREIFHVDYLQNLHPVQHLQPLHVICIIIITVIVL